MTLESVSFTFDILSSEIMEIQAALKALKEANKPKVDGQNEDFLSQNRQLRTVSDDSTTEILAELEVELQDENNEKFSNEIFLEKININVTPVQDLEMDIPNLEVVISENNGAQADAKIRKKNLHLSIVPSSHNFPEFENSFQFDP